MKKKIILLAMFANSITAIFGQTDTRVINTAVPFLEIPTSAAGLAMGNSGVAMAGDDNSFYYNPAKIAFQKNIDVFSASYIPWMREFASDMKLAAVNYSYKMDDDQTVGGGLTYFNMGRMIIKDENGSELGNIRTNEFAITGTYARALNYESSVALTVRGIYSRILNTDGYQVPTTKGAWGVSADLSFFRTIELDYYKNLRLGFNLSNIGPKMGYTKDRSAKTAIPTNLRFGVSYDNQVNDDNSLSFALDINKLLVATPPIYNQSGEIIKGKNPNRTFLNGIFTSFSDAPGGLKEELQEINICAGGEYRFKEVLAIRAGASYEHKTKGNRSYIGTGIEYKGNYYDQLYSISAFYIIPYGSATVQSPLKNTFGVSVKILLGEY